ncbi:iron transporter [Streptomyces sp. NBC_01239]|uniref:IucA/IucC family protein n=1 Tax=Streptomyces sp. NBC_01239 TaxID=2903792 RepID=UPI00224F8814|nr:IucA/IucC family protein [Streptomyces sp. NBC_01239]MCX4814359.1 iron transporter [Streptomyces sp. NBC_01239]
MNPTPTPDGNSHEASPHHTQALTASVASSAESVPRQRPRSPEVGRPRNPEAEQSRGTTSDFLEHPDPHTAAQSAAVENLLRCWVRETNLPTPTNGTLHIPLPASGTALLAQVHYWSPTGWHRFGLPYLSTAPYGAPPVDAVTVAALLARETVVRDDGSGTGADIADGVFEGEALQDTGHVAAAADGSANSGSGLLAEETAAATGPSASAAAPVSDTGTDLVARVADSVRRTVTFITERRTHPADDPDLFLSAEQALLLGHPLHPTPKSREGLSDAEVRLYSPELRGSFPLHWLAVAPSVLATDSAWTERGRPVPAAHLTARLAGPELPLPEGHAALPLHPWQWREIQNRADISALLDAGLLQDLGTYGAPWHPTSSVRTVHQSGAPAMLKLSLGLRITNSRRENLRKELHRGVEVHRLLRTGLSQQWRAAHPGFDIVRDPAWLAVDALAAPAGLDESGTEPGERGAGAGASGVGLGHGGSDRAGRAEQDARVPLAGIDVVIRHNPFSPSDDVSCVAGFVSLRPYAGRSAATGGPVPTPHSSHPASGAPPLRSRLAEVITGLAARTGRPRGAVAAEWFLRYLEQVVRPVLWLDSEAGIALEAHQQNTLLLLDGEGWPVGGRYRDNQGYYFRESRRAELDARLPGIGEHSDTFVSDEVTDERFAYYLAINNVLGLIGAFGSQRLADERLLLSAFRRFLGDVATGPARLRTSLPAHLLDSPVLRCKANLLTRLHGLDELIGPVDTQSVYVTISNPLCS